MLMIDAALIILAGSMFGDNAIGANVTGVYLAYFGFWTLQLGFETVSAEEGSNSVT